MDKVWYQTDEVSLYHSPTIPGNGLWPGLASSDPSSHHSCLQPCMPRSIGIKTSWQRQGCSLGNPASAASVTNWFILEHAEADSGLCGGSQIQVRVISCQQQDREPELHTQGEPVFPAAALTLCHWAELPSKSAIRGWREGCKLNSGLISSTSPPLNRSGDENMWSCSTPFSY